MRRNKVIDMLLVFGQSRLIRWSKLLPAVERIGMAILMLAVNKTSGIAPVHVQQGRAKDTPTLMYSVFPILSNCN